jgi:hypothetical protein
VFFGEDSFYPSPAHSSNFCHQPFSFGGIGALGAAVGCGLFGFGGVAAGIALAGDTELPFELAVF